MRRWKLADTCDYVLLLRTIGAQVRDLVEEVPDEDATGPICDLPQHGADLDVAARIQTVHWLHWQSLGNCVFVYVLEKEKNC